MINGSDPLGRQQTGLGGDNGHGVNSAVDGTSRKPRIEVLRARAGDPANAAGDASLQPRRPDGRQKRRVRFPFLLLLLLAAVVIVAGLGLTYYEGQSSKDYAVEEQAPVLEGAEVPTETAAYDEEPTSPAPREETRPVPAEPAERTVAQQGEEVAAPRPQEEPAPEPETAAEETSALGTVRAFYGALGSGDGGSAAQLVVPFKRASGPLSGAALTRYFSSHRRPLRVRRASAVDADTVAVSYDYVLADGRLCEGRATVDVVQRGGATLVSGIRTQGPC